jgi:hypothetical protein
MFASAWVTEHLRTVAEEEWLSLANMIEVLV